MPLIHQKWLKWESETNIINALSEEDKRFSELLELTELSKPVLISRLKELKKKGKVEFIPNEETRRFQYHLIQENCDLDDMIQIGIHILSKDIVETLKEVAKNPKLSDKKYNQALNDLIPMLFKYRNWAYSSASEELQKEWLKVSLGMNVSKNVEEIFPAERVISSELRPIWQLATNYPPNSREFKEYLLKQIYSKIEYMRKLMMESPNENKSD